MAKGTNLVCCLIVFKLQMDRSTSLSGNASSARVADSAQPKTSRKGKKKRSRKKLVKDSSPVPRTLSDKECWDLLFPALEQGKSSKDHQSPSSSSSSAYQSLAGTTSVDLASESSSPVTTGHDTAVVQCAKVSSAQNSSSTDPVEIVPKRRKRRRRRKRARSRSIPSLAVDGIAIGGCKLSQNKSNSTTAVVKPPSSLLPKRSAKTIPHSTVSNK